jgi:hypothetical protein
MKLTSPTLDETIAMVRTAHADRGWPGDPAELVREIYKSFESDFTTPQGPIASAECYLATPPTEEERVKRNAFMDGIAEKFGWTLTERVEGPTLTDYIEEPSLADVDPSYLCVEITLVDLVEHPDDGVNYGAPQLNVNLFPDGAVGWIWPPPKNFGYGFDPTALGYDNGTYDESLDEDEAPHDVTFYLR